MEGESFRVLFRTFGCKANQYDTERMRQELEALGAPVHPPDPEGEPGDPGGGRRMFLGP
jgi:hypothetical protein